MSTHRTSADPASPSAVARLIGAGLIVAAGAIHLDLYLTGYRYIRTIGWMFLAQVAAAFLIGAALIVTIRLAGRPLGRLVAAAGAGFALATLGGYLISLQFALFGFQETRTTAGIVAGIIEVIALVVLATQALGRLERVAPRQVGYLVGPVTAIASILLVLAEVAGGAGAATGATSPGHATASGTVMIVIKNFAFHPADPTATAGERIVVKNEDPVAHTFTAMGKEIFNSGPIVPNTSRSVIAPGKPGKYGFLCLIHRYMTGTLTVVAAS